MIPTTDKILSGIESEGYSVVPGFVPQGTLQRFMSEVHRRFNRQSFNGTIGHVCYANQKYLQHTLAVHEEILKLYLHPVLVECSERYIGSDVHLQDYRIYQNLEGCEIAGNRSKGVDIFYGGKGEFEGCDIHDNGSDGVAVGPRGTKQATATVGGHTWDVYRGSNGTNAVFSFVRTSNTNSGTVDVLARAISPALHQALGQPIIIENRSGAGGNIGAEFVAKSAQDGYTLLMGGNSALVINPSLYETLPFDPIKR